MPSKTQWETYTPEQREKYLATQRNKRLIKRKEEHARSMLARFLSATNAKEKREVIKDFAPHYFVFGNELNPTNPYKENENETV